MKVTHASIGELDSGAWGVVVTRECDVRPANRETWRTYAMANIDRYKALAILNETVLTGKLSGLVTWHAEREQGT